MGWLGHSCTWLLGDIVVPVAPRTLIPEAQVTPDGEAPGLEAWVLTKSLLLSEPQFLPPGAGMLARRVPEAPPDWQWDGRLACRVRALLRARPPALRD